MPIFGKNAFDNAARAQETGQNSVTWQGDLKVTGTVTAEGGEAGAVNLPNNTYLTAENAAGTSTTNLLRATAGGETEVNAPTGNGISFTINSIVKATLDATSFVSLTEGILSLGTSAIGWGTVFLGLGKTVQLKAGANAKAGTFTANGVTPVSVATTAFVAGSAVIISLKTVGGTVGPIPHLATATPATGFTVVGTAADTSVYNWAIIDQA